jgi:hypothetical protein
MRDIIIAGLGYRIIKDHVAPLPEDEVFAGLHSRLVEETMA